jgi:hypothetical protein
MNVEFYDMINAMSQRIVPKKFYGSAPDESKVPAPDPKDVETIEAIITASYETISGAAGKPREWERMGSLFLPESRQIRTGNLDDNGRNSYKLMSTDDFVELTNDWLVENGFFETEIHRVVDQFGSIAQVFSTYESRRNADDPAPYLRGINTFQLFHDGRRWWIVNIMWRHESPDLPIPAKYLPA